MVGTELQYNQRVSNHKPRKGTETRILLLIVKQSDCFKSQTPQGDGNCPRFDVRLLFCRVSNHKPRKGTETSANNQRDHALDTRRFKSQTPQGDGNGRGRLQHIVRVLAVSNHKPRKGTETITKGNLELYRFIDGFKSQTPQGDGNLLAVSFARWVRVTFQITNPARGRKRCGNRRGSPR